MGTVVALAGQIGGAKLAHGFARLRGKQFAVIVNTGRGRVLDTAAVARLLAEGHLAGAALDVFRNEPPHADELALLSASPNVVLTPHAGFYAVDTDIAIRRAACAHLLAELGSTTA